MKNEMDIQLRQALMMMAQAQNEAAFYKSQARNCVSIEEYNAVKTERDSLRELCGRLTEREQDVRKERDELRTRLSETEKRLEESEADRKKIKAENRDLKRQISDLEDTNALLTADKFGPGSEVMERLFGKDAEVPKDLQGLLAMLSQKGYDCDKALNSIAKEGGQEEKAVCGTSPEKEDASKKRNPRGKDRRKRTVWVEKDSVIFPVDDSNIPGNARLVARQGDDGIWTFRLLYIRRMRAIVARPKDFGKRVIDACNYFLNDEEGFRAFLDNGLIELHNNPIYPNFSFIQTFSATG